MQATDSPSEPRLGIQILNWNGWRDTLECLDSMRQIIRSGIKVVVCDNGSSDGSINRIGGWGHSVLGAEGVRVLDRTTAESASEIVDAGLIVIENGANLGFAGGNNVGLRYLLRDNVDFVWILNNDTVTAPDALSELVVRAQEDAAIGIVGSKILDFEDRDTVLARGGASYDPRRGIARHLGLFESAKAPDDRTETEAEMDYVVGASMLVSRPFLKQVGLMQEDYFLYFEELDWAVRGRKLGFRLAYAPESVVYHREGSVIGTSQQGPGSTVSLRFLCRNRLRFTRRFYAQFFWSVWRRIAFEALVYLKRRQVRAAGIAFLSLLGLSRGKPPKPRL